MTATYGSIPLTLAENISVLLNNKLGTTSGYSPNQWLNAINLTGPLPEKTASGAIASFTDGADDVPVKEAVF